MLKRFAGIVLFSCFGFGVDCLWNPLSAQTLLNLNSASLTIEVEGAKNLDGQVCASLFSSSKGFPAEDERILQRECTLANQTPLTINFTNLKAGNYAIAIMHDENNDERLNRDLLGLPLEGFGFSRNPEIIDRPPSFSETAVFVAGNSTAIKVKLKYM